MRGGQRVEGGERAGERRVGGREGENKNKKIWETGEKRRKETILAKTLKISLTPEYNAPIQVKSILFTTQI